MTGALATLLAYLLGSLSGSLLLGRLRGVDVRRHGSGNAGGTNAFRVLGARFALGVVAVDVGKGALAAAALPALAATLTGPPQLPPTGLALLCGFAAVLGHCYPLYHGFRGGKGAGTFLGVLLVLMPAAAGLALLGWLAVLTTTGYVSLATMVAALLLVPVGWALAPAADASLWLGFAIPGALLILWTHRANIGRLRRGDESRFDGARLFSRSR